MSGYDEQAPKLAKKGHHPLPIGPGTKAPHRYTPSLGKFELYVGWQERPEPLTTPQPGAGIGVRLGKGLVALDYDNEDAALRVSEALGGSHVNKAGKTAWTEFYHADFPVPSEDFANENGELMLQVLSDGRQTVIPPTIHPDTGEPYRWTNGASLYDTPLDQLPALPADYRERIIALGYQPGRSKKQAQTEKEGDGPLSSEQTRPIYDDGSPFVELNRLAMQKLPAWIPVLGLERCRRKRGRQDAYEAVPTWRPNKDGKKTADRRFNLKISAERGIVDFGAPGWKGYSALDLVMAARSCSLSDAVTWLTPLVRPERGPDVDFEALAQAESPPTGGAEEFNTNEGDDPIPPASLGKAWHFGDPVPAQQPMLIPDVLPLKGFGYLGGQWGTMKTFITNDLAVAIGSQGEVAGRQVAIRGAVVLIELEASNTEVRLHGAAIARGVDDPKLPIVQLRAEPPSILTNGRRNPAWGKWSADLAQYAQRFAASRGVPLAMIILDPQNSFAGFQDEQSSSEGQIVSNALWALSRQADCLVLATDHLGKNVDAGLRGTSAKETNPLFILSTGATKKDTYVQRQLEIRKMRNGRAGIAVGFSMRDQDVTLYQMGERDGIVRMEAHTSKTLVVSWGEEFNSVNASDEGRAGEVSAQQRRALVVLNEMVSARGTLLPPECDAPEGMMGVKLESWRVRLIDKTVIEGKNLTAAFSQLKNALLDRREIDISHGYVWVPLP
jgi:hypothetical protein